MDQKRPKKNESIVFNCDLFRSCYQYKACTPVKYLSEDNLGVTFIFDLILIWINYSTEPCYRAVSTSKMCYGLMGGFGIFGPEIVKWVVLPSKSSLATIKFQKVSKKN